MISKFINTTLQGHVLDVLKPFPDECFDMIMTSPPYWSLRKYECDPVIWDGDPSCNHEWGDPQKSYKQSGGKPNCRERSRHISYHHTCNKCNAWRGNLGNEPNFDLYLKHLCSIFDECYRVLKKEGTCWVVMGDTYWTAKGSCFNPGGGKNSFNKDNNKKAFPLHRGNRSDIPGYPIKSLCMIPSRFSINMIDHGWILRNDIIWHKPNAKPNYAYDRFTHDYEHIFFFTKSDKYYFEQQYEPQSPNTHSRGKNPKTTDRFKEKCSRINGTIAHKDWQEKTPDMKLSRGKIKRSVWSISKSTSTVAHYAIYPERLIEDPMRAGCPVGGIILDPFMGSGTTARVALRLRRKFVGIELSESYNGIIDKKLSKPLQIEAL